jgi:hypothetical protein
MVSLDMSDAPSYLFITNHIQLRKRRHIFGVTKVVVFAGDRNVSVVAL